MEERFETFTLLITSISRSIRRLKTEETAEINLKGPHVSCLYHLYKGGPMTAVEICEVCDEDKAAVSRSLLYLENHGFLVREGNASERIREGGKHYRSPLLLTERGTETARGLVERIDHVLEAVSIGVSEEDRANMYRTLKQIDENLRDLCDGDED